MKTLMAWRSEQGSQPFAVLRRWAVRLGLACLALEASYLVVGNLCLRLGLLEDLINRQPEAVFVSWESGHTFLPGFAALEGFVYRGQTMEGQTYVHLAEVNGRVSVMGLFSRTVDFRGVDARDVDFRFRERIDYPCWTEDDGRPFPDPPANLEFFPEIPGFENPPNPRPEDIYSSDDDSKPWIFRISQAHLEGSVLFAHNDLRIIGVGSATGGLTIVLGESNAIDRAVVRLRPAEVTWASRELTDDLALEVDVNVKPFPAVCAELSDVMEGTSGTLTLAGTESSGFAVNIHALTPLLPGQGVLSLESGIGALEVRLEKRERKSASGRLDLVADDVILKREEIPLQGDLEVHASLTEGNLATGTFDVSDSTIRLDDIAQSGSSEKQRQKLEPWYGHVEIEEGFLTFGSPMTMNGHVRMAMEDTRPVLIVLRKFTSEMRWLNLTRNVKQLDGTMDLGFGAGYLTVDNLDLAGEGVEILGWFHIRDQIKDGRLYARHGARAVGFAFDRGEGRLVTKKPRHWFDEQQGSPPTGGSPGPGEDEPR